MATHAKLSPSGAHRWAVCPASAILEEGKPSTRSKYSDEGTAAHFLLSESLENDMPSSYALGAVIEVSDEGARWLAPDDPIDDVPDSAFFTVDDEMVRHVQGVIDRAKQFSGVLYPEAELEIDHITGEEGATGTSDIVVIGAEEIVVIDLKYGMGEQVSAENNYQLAMYASAALRHHAIAIDMVGATRVRMVIDQPRIDHYDEWVIEIDELNDFVLRNISNAVPVIPLAIEHKANWIADPKAVYYAPDEKTCRWCKAKSECPAIGEMVLSVVGANCFEDLTAIADPGRTDIKQKSMPMIRGGWSSDDEELSDKLKAVGLIEDWCKAVRAEVETRLLAGREVPGFKLVRGKKGNRKWSSEEEAEALLKKMRIKHDQMYEYKLISPTTAEKLAKSNVIGERQWPKLQGMITQADGALSVAPMSDKREAVSVAPTANDFEDISGNSLL